MNKSNLFDNFDVNFDDLVNNDQTQQASGVSQPQAVQDTFDGVQDTFSTLVTPPVPPAVNVESNEPIVIDDVNAFFNDVDKVEQENKGKSKKKTTTPTTPSTLKVLEIKGPRVIKAYGDELWVENDVNVTNEQIRERIVNEFGYSEFTKEKTVYDYNAETGILDVGKLFHKKG